MKKIQSDVIFLILNKVSFNILKNNQKKNQLILISLKNMIFFEKKHLNMIFFFFYNDVTLICYF